MTFVISWRNKLLDRALSATAFTVPTNVYHSPFASAPASDGTGGVEITGNGAGRRIVTWGSVSSGQVANSVAVTVGTASADWALANAFALMDQTGAIIAYGPTNPAKQVLNGQAWVLQPGQIQIADTAQATDTDLTHYTMNGLLTELIGGAAPSWPSQPWWGLITAPFDRAGAGGTEVSTGGGSNYARVHVGMAAAASGAKAPSGAITFAIPATAWGRIVSLGAWDASSSGNLLWQADLDSPIVPSVGTAPSFNASQVSITLT